jgi:hypothetical protein
MECKWVYCCGSWSWNICIWSPCRGMIGIVACLLECCISRNVCLSYARQVISRLRYEQRETTRLCVCGRRCGGCWCIHHVVVAVASLVASSARGSVPLLSPHVFELAFAWIARWIRAIVLVVSTAGAIPAYRSYSVALLLVEDTPRTAVSQGSGSSVDLARRLRWLRRMVTTAVTAGFVARCEGGRGRVREGVVAGCRRRF